MLRTRGDIWERSEAYIGAVKVLLKEKKKNSEQEPMC